MPIAVLIYALKWSVEFISLQGCHEFIHISGTSQPVNVQLGMMQEKVTVRTHIHRISASVIKEVRKNLFQNTDFVALGIKCQEFALFLVCKIVNTG